MARNAIYVGGKEIIRRYVGNKIVWRKFYYKQIFSGNYFVHMRGTEGLDLVLDIYSNHSQELVGNFGEGKVEFNGGVVSFSRLNGRFINDSNIRNNRQVVTITFFNSYDKDTFRSYYSQTTINENIKVFIKAYK